MSSDPESLLANDSVKVAETPGIRFKPKDEHLVDYLAGKLYGCTSGTPSRILQLIKEVDIYQHEPSQLSDFASDFGDRKWNPNMYFFTTLEMENQNGTNVNRLASGGFWEKTENHSFVKDGNGKVIAAKTPFVYYKNDQNSGKPVKTHWLMYEYMLVEKQSTEDIRMLAPLTLCVVSILDNNKRRRCEIEDERQESMNNQSPGPETAEGSSQKRHRPCSDLPEICQNVVSTPVNQKQDHKSSSNPPANIYPSMNPDDEDPIRYLGSLFSNDHESDCGC